MTSLLGDGLTASGTALTADLHRRGTGTGVLAGVGSDGIAYRSLSGADGLSLSEEDGTISVGVAETQTETTDTFTESGVTTSNTAVENDSIVLPSSTATRPTDDETFTGSSRKYGIGIQPQSHLAGVTVTVSNNTSDESMVYLTGQDGKTLTSEPSPGSGNQVTLTHPLSANVEYFVVVDNDGGDYSPGHYNGADFSYESDHVVIHQGVNISDGDPTNQFNDAYCISDVTGFVGGGSATVEWNEPASVSRWETATFQAAQDGETVEVYVETSSDGGSSWSEWTTNPIPPGTDLSSIPADHRVRFRVELSRADVSNEPRLTLLGRQWRS